MSETAINLPGIGAVEESVDAALMARAATVAELAGLRRWALLAAWRIAQGVVMVAVGVFLLREIPTTPGLMLQMGLLGGLLVVGGLAFVHAGLSGTAGGKQAA